MKFKINTEKEEGDWLKSFHGQQVTIPDNPVTGKSDQTKLYALPQQGQGLFLRDDQVVAV